MQTQLSYRDITLSDNTYTATKRVLCDRCDHPVCSNFAAMQCADFTPRLNFKAPLMGFDFPRFNTFRCGTAWVKRLQKGSLVAIFNTKTYTVVGHAYVTEVHFGNKQRMAELHGLFNHSMLALEIVDNIAETMLKRLKNSSGSMIYNSSDDVSVIYLEMLDGNEKEKHMGVSRE